MDLCTIRFAVELTARVKPKGRVKVSASVRLNKNNSGAARVN